MRAEPNDLIEPFRIRDSFPSSPYGVNWGAFVIPTKTGVHIRIISSGTDEEHGWEHVSVSLVGRCPTWEEMQMVKQLFWKDDEVVMQLHPATDQYVNVHPNCLHMWRPLRATIPLPPKVLV